MKKLLILDFVIFGLATIIIDTILAQQVLFGITLYVSIALPILFIMYIRWGYYAIIMNVLFSLLHMIIFKSPWLVNVLHGLSLLIMISSLAVIKFKAFNQRYIKFGYILLAYLSLYSLVFLVEYGLLKLFGDIEFVSLLVSQSLNVVAGLLILTIMYFQKDLIVNMKLYLKRESQKNIKDDGYGL